MTPLAPGEDAARAQTELPLPPAVLLEFLADAERLWRLNPLLEIAAWQARSDGCAAAGTNESNGLPFAWTARRTALPGRGFRLDYAAGLKRSTEFVVEPAPAGVLLTVTERYEPLADAADPRAREADRSLVPWVAALRRHLLARRRWSRLPGWFWWSERFLPSMPPRQRRIVRLLVWTSALEFAVFAAAVAVLRLP